MEQHKFIWILQMAGIFSIIQGPDGLTTASINGVKIIHNSNFGLTGTVTIGFDGKVYIVPSHVQLNEIIMIIKNGASVEDLTNYCSKYLEPSK